MRRFSPLEYVRAMPLTHKFYAAITFVVLVLVLELASFWFALNTVSSIRAYVRGEGLWSKAQKESLNSLLRYVATYQESAYEDSRAYLSVPLGDKQARTELEKEQPNLAIARQGFLDGGNHPEDIEGMISLYRSFRHEENIERAIEIWTEGEALLARQIELGERMHEIISVRPYDPVTRTALAPLVSELVANDRALTELEDKFSETLSEGFRQISARLLIAIAMLTVFLGAVAFAVALYLLRVLTQVDKAKTEFVALATHQLRSPLNTIGLSAELLQHTAIAHSSDAQKIVDDISNEITRMAKLIDAILNVSRIELGTLIAEPRMMDVVACAQSEVASMTKIAERNGLRVHESYSHDTLSASMDQVLLRVIIQNLLSNAIKYTPRGGTIRLSVVRQPARILIRVADTGTGIPADQQPHIFRKLFRTAHASKVDPHGTGLGLYVVKALVTETGGDIWFDSTEGTGTTFYVSFPLSGMRAVRGAVRLRE